MLWFLKDLLQENYQLKSSLQEYKSKENWYKEEISQYEQASSHGHGRSDKNDKQFRVKEVELKEKVFYTKGEYFIILSHAYDFCYQHLITYIYTMLTAV